MNIYNGTTTQLQTNKLEHTYTTKRTSANQTQKKQNEYTHTHTQ